MATKKKTTPAKKKATTTKETVEQYLIQTNIVTIITIFRHQKMAVAFLGTNQIFNNFGSGEDFDAWWEEYKKGKKIKKLTKIEHFPELIERKRLLFKNR